MTDEELREKVKQIMNNSLDAMPTKDLQTILREHGMSDELKPMELSEVRVVSLLPDRWATVETPTPLQLLWCWFVGYEKTQAIAFEEGKPVANPLAVFSWAESIVTNWWKYLVVIIILVLALAFFL